MVRVQHCINKLAWPSVDLIPLTIIDKSDQRGGCGGEKHVMRWSVQVYWSVYVSPFRRSSHLDGFLNLYLY